MTCDPVARDLLAALRDPRTIARLERVRATDVIARARASDLLGRIGARAYRHGAMAALPERIQGVLEAPLVAAQAFHRMARFETDRLRRALKPLDHDIVLLKGSAYIVAGLSPAPGRRISDIDILLPRARVSEAERLLLGSGWGQLQYDDYDERYFREWMHELPPLRHLERETMIDLHHTILPLTGRINPNPDLLIADAVPVAGWHGVRVLSPADMVLHNIVHHFQDGEIEHSLRELVDLDDLIQTFAPQPKFWDKLCLRTAQLGFGRPAFYAFRYAHRLLGTAVPDDVLLKLLRYAPPAPVVAIMDRLVTASLSRSGTPPTTLTEFIAERSLYARAQWLKMPPSLLARHAAAKVIRSIRRRFRRGTRAEMTST